MGKVCLFAVQLSPPSPLFHSPSHTLPFSKPSVLLPEKSVYGQQNRKGGGCNVAVIGHKKTAADFPPRQGLWSFFMPQIKTNGGISNES